MTSFLRAFVCSCRSFRPLLPGYSSRNVTAEAVATDTNQRSAAETSLSAFGDNFTILPLHMRIASWEQLSLVTTLPLAPLANLVIDTALSNSPYSFSSGSATYDNIIIGIDASGILNQSGGSLSVTFSVILDEGGIATYNLDGGTLTTGDIEAGNGGRTSIFNFNGGTLRPNADNTSFFSGLTRANVRNGGAIFDTNGFNITVGQVLEHSNIGGDNDADGGLTKNGAGTLTLTAVETYNGGTMVNGGTLRLGD